MFAIMIARKMGFASNGVFFKLSMAGIFHDIGKKEIDRIIIEKPRPLLSLSERQIVETHTTRGKEILSSVKNISSEILRLVDEHHEDCVGQGYPRHLKLKDLHPLTPILFLANVFAGKVIAGPGHAAVPAAESISQIRSLYGDRVSPAALKALQLLFPNKPESRNSE